MAFDPNFDPTRYVQHQPQTGHPAPPGGPTLNEEEKKADAVAKRILLSPAAQRPPATPVPSQQEQMDQQLYVSKIKRMLNDPINMLTYRDILSNPWLAKIGTVTLSTILWKILAHRGSEGEDLERLELLSRFVRTPAFKNMRHQDVSSLVQQRPDEEWSYWVSKPKEMKLLETHPQGKEIIFIKRLDPNDISGSNR